MNIYLLINLMHAYLHITLIYYTYGSTYSRNGSNVPYMQYKMFTFIKFAVEST